MRDFCIKFINFLSVKMFTMFFRYFVFGKLTTYEKLCIIIINYLIKLWNNQDDR